MSLITHPSICAALALGFSLAVALMAVVVHRVLSHVLAADPDDDSLTPAVPQPGDHHARS